MFSYCGVNNKQRTFEVKKGHWERVIALLALKNTSLNVVVRSPGVFNDYENVKISLCARAALVRNEIRFCLQSFLSKTAIL